MVTIAHVTNQCSNEARTKAGARERSYLKPRSHTRGFKGTDATGLQVDEDYADTFSSSMLTPYIF